MKKLQHRLHKNNSDLKENILDVSQAVPGIELGHFCVNDSYKRRKKEWVITHGVLPYTVGAYIFYKFIAPKVIEISQIVGSQYLYLFCADDGSESLLNYYVNVLNFSIMDQMACVRTEYDRGLTCLTIKIETLKAAYVGIICNAFEAKSGCAATCFSSNFEKVIRIHVRTPKRGLKALHLSTA